MNKLYVIYKLFNRFLEDRKEFSLKVACARLLLDCPWLSWEKRRQYYEEVIYSYLRNMWIKIDNFFKYKDSEDVDSSTIWVMWWQGEEMMPPIVRTCFKQLKSVAGKEKVVLITEKNYQDYISIPLYIRKKVEKGNITLTHLSDIIRVMLLNEYGGLWIDSTVYVSKLPKGFFDQKFFTLKNVGMFPEFISRGEWSPYLLYINKKNYILFQKIYIFLIRYWSDHNKLIDYLMIDYMLKIVKDNDSNINSMMDDVCTTKGYYDMNLKINEKFDNKCWKQMCNRSSFHKLTYKKLFKDEDEKGNETYYHYLISQGGNYPNE